MAFIVTIREAGKPYSRPTYFGLTQERYDISCSEFHPLRREIARFKIEIKPAIGDDYPAVLRQMRINKSTTLFVGAYNGVGATREQFIATMKTAGIAVVFAADVQSLT